MGKRAKGLNAVRQNNAVKKSILSACKKYAEQLEKENYELKNNPDTVIGKFIGQFRELYAQNQRLSVLAACLIQKLGEATVLTKEDMEQFQNKRINIKWEIGDDETVETAKAYTFTYETEDAPPQGQPVQATQQPGAQEFEECTDPSCTLPKDLKHRHTTAPQVETEKAPDEKSSLKLTYFNDAESEAEAEQTGEFIDSAGGGEAIGQSLPYAKPEICTDPNCGIEGEHIHEKSLKP
jgi:hypothetical protein